MAHSKTHTYTHISINKYSDNEYLTDQDYNLIYIINFNRYLCKITRMTLETFRSIGYVLGGLITF